MLPVKDQLRRLALGLGFTLGLPWLGYSLWDPGVSSSQGRYDRGRNGLWIAHGWMADDSWFAINRRDRAGYDSVAARERLQSTCEDNGIGSVFPHLCPATQSGDLPAHDPVRAEALLDALPAVKVLPWVGGVHGRHCPVESPVWRARFVLSCAELLRRHPRLAGLHLNIEPMPDGNAAFLSLLEELKTAMPPDKMISVAAYPPPTRWHPHPEVHWSEIYYREVDRRCDQLVPMMYDTSLRLEKVYTRLVASWTRDVARWTTRAELLLGLPAYEDEQVAYHDPRVENVGNALRGANAGLLSLGPRANRIVGIALYADWTTTPEEWVVFRSGFRGPSLPAGPDANTNPPSGVPITPPPLRAPSRGSPRPPHAPGRSPASHARDKRRAPRDCPPRISA